MSEKVFIAQVLQSNIAVDVDGGALVRQLVQDEVVQGRSVEVSFDGVTMTTTAFVNAMVIPLYESFETALVDSAVSFVDTHVSDRRRLDRARERAIQLRSHPAPSDDSVTATYL